MIQQRDALWWRRLNGAMRLAMVRGSVPGLGGIVVTEYPKSGGSWMAQMLSRALDLPFPRNRLPGMRSSILHGHYLPGQIGRPCITIWRDGRDVMVSLYHHRVGVNAYATASVNEEARRTLRIVQPDDVSGNLPRFIEHVAQGRTFPRYHWGHFVQQWHDSDTPNCGIRYEDMLADAAGALRTAGHHLGHDLTGETAETIAQEFSFTRQAGRTPGAEDRTSYLRKGIAGDWRNAFSDEAKDVFKHYMGDALVRLGYESDLNW